jgi:chromosome partitioning protein
MPRHAGARGRIILVASPKGGVGKSSLSRNILVSAAMSGLKVLGMDLDQQQTLLKWHDRRERVRRNFPELAPVPVIALAVDDWRDAVAQASNYDLVVIDTAPTIEVGIGAALKLSSSADLVLVPTGATQDDVDSVGPWMQTLDKGSVHSAFVLNKANRRVKSYETVRTKLVQTGPLCPIEIPMLEDIHVSSGKGMAVPDVTTSKATDIFAGLWAWVAREAGVKQQQPVAA